MVPIVSSVPFVTLLLLSSCRVPAQDQPAFLLLGNRWYDAASLQPGQVAKDLDAQRPRVEMDGTVHLGDSVVDPARGLVLTIVDDQLRLRRAPDRELWRKPLTTLRLEPPVQLAQTLLTKNLVLVPDQEDDLVAIDLADGAPRWRDSGGERGGIVHDDELVASFMQTDAGRVIRVLALTNGARACTIAAPPGAEFVVLAPHGLLVGGPTGASVFARTGPLLFSLPGDVHAAVGDEYGFCLHLGKELVAFDPKGKERWRQPLAAQWPDSVRLTAVPGGLVVVTQFPATADDGATVSAHEHERGELAWQRRLPGLGVDHSKYWQDVVTFPRAAQIVVTSHAAGGHWLALLDRSGAVQGRIDAPGR